MDLVETALWWTRGTSHDEPAAVDDEGVAAAALAADEATVVDDEGVALSLPGSES